jgi:hypothetical protein
MPSTPAPQPAAEQRPVVINQSFDRPAAPPQYERPAALQQHERPNGVLCYNVDELKMYGLMKPLTDFRYVLWKEENFCRNITAFGCPEKKDY